MLRNPDETEADDLFRQDALRLGYLPEDEHEPGNGRGLARYFRDHGIVPPENLRRWIPKRELTGFHLDGEIDCG